MLINWDGTDYLYDDRRVKVSQAAIIKRETGLDWPMEFAEAIGKLNPDAVRAMMWLVRLQNGHIERIEDVDGSVMEFLEAYSKGVEAELAKQAAKDAEGSPNPTEPSTVDGSPTTSSNSETSTSPASE
jgi:hypothetical protein